MTAVTIVPRRNPHLGIDCPPWCIVDHTWKYGTICGGICSPAGKAWVCVIRDHEGFHVAVMGIEDGPSVQFRLSTEDAAKLAALTAMAGAPELAGAIRQAVTAIEEASGA